MKTEERKAFENWITAPPYEKDVTINSEKHKWAGQYSDYQVQLAWEAWKESKR